MKKILLILVLPTRLTSCAKRNADRILSNGRRSGIKEMTNANI